MLHVASTVDFEYASSNVSYKNYRIRVDADTVLALTEKGLSIVNGTQPAMLTGTFLLYVPLSIICIALPHMVQAEDKSVSFESSSQFISYF